MYLFGNAHFAIRVGLTGRKAALKSHIGQPRNSLRYKPAQTRISYTATEQKGRKVLALRKMAEALRKKIREIIKELCSPRFYVRGGGYRKHRRRKNEYLCYPVFNCPLGGIY